MHTLAAHYPHKPSLYEQVHAANFYRALAALYPCTHCRDDFHASVAQQPPRCGCQTAGGVATRALTHAAAAEWSRARRWRCGCASSTTQ